MLTRMSSSQSSHNAGRDVKRYNHLAEFGDFYKAKHSPPLHPAVSLLDIYLREMKTRVQNKTYTRIASIWLFITAQNGNNPKVLNRINNQQVFVQWG